MVCVVPLFIQFRIESSYEYESNELNYSEIESIQYVTKFSLYSTKIRFDIKVFKFTKKCFVTSEKFSVYDVIRNKTHH